MCVVLFVVFLSRVTRRQYYWFEFLFTFFAFFVYFLVFIRAIRYFGLHAATLILISGFVGSPVLMCGHYSPAFIVMGHCNTLLYALLATSHQCF